MINKRVSRVDSTSTFSVNNRGPRRRDFADADKIKILLWCGRHCCLCNRLVGPGIEIAHLEKPDDNRIDNAIPLCFDCHASTGHYNDKHPRGRKYAVQELRARRDQIYEEHTRHLVSPVKYRIFQELHERPEVDFDIRNMGETYPIRVRVRITLSQGKRSYGSPRSLGHYDGRYLWNLNPHQGCHGHFRLPTNMKRNEVPIRARVDVSILDIYEREHVLLPVGWVLPKYESADWYFEPVEIELGSILQRAGNITEFGK